MTFSSTNRLAVCALTVFSFVASPDVSAQSDPQTEYKSGFYLQVHERDFEKAAAAFEKVAADTSAPEKLRNDARTRAAQCREDIVAADLTRLAPPNAIAFVEIRRPGEHIAQVLRLVGLLRGQTPAANEKAERIKLGGPVSIPADFAVSPHLLSEISQLQGIAVAVTGVSIGRNPRPQGLVILHPGETGLARGALETAVQFLEPAESIAGFRSFAFMNEAFVCVTHRLVLVAPNRQTLVEAVERLRSPSAPRLADQPRFTRLKSDRENALVFVALDGQRLFQHIFPVTMVVNEARIAANLVDLKNIDGISAAAKTTPAGFGITLRMDLKEGHKNLAYSAVRTAPFSQRTLKHVPAGVAGVVMLGLNPPEGSAPTNSSTNAEVARYVAVMDLGRELFSNIEELAGFAVPKPMPAGASPTREAAFAAAFPDIGVVFGVKDAAKSEQLWTQIMSIAFLAGAPFAGPPRDTTIEKVAVKEFAFKGAPPVCVARLKERVLVVGTAGAVEAAVRAEKNAVNSDAAFKEHLSQLKPTASKAAVVHIGRVLDIVRGFMSGDERQELDLARQINRNLVVSALSDEEPTRLSIHAQVTGLPNALEVAQMVQKMPAPLYSIRMTNFHDGRRIQIFARSRGRDVLRQLPGPVPTYMICGLSVSFGKEQLAIGSAKIAVPVEVKSIDVTHVDGVLTIRGDGKLLHERAAAPRAPNQAAAPLRANP